MAMERLYLGALTAARTYSVAGGTTTYSVQGATLELRTAGGAIAASFSRLR